MSTFEGMNEEQALDMLFETSEKPHATYRIGRLNLEIEMCGLMASRVYEIREMCTYRKKERGTVTARLDEEKFNCELIAASTTKMAVVVKGENADRKVVASFSGWDDPKILSKLKLSGADTAIKRMLLAGELDVLGNAVLDLSGYNTDLEDVKN